MENSGHGFVAGKIVPIRMSGRQPKYPKPHYEREAKFWVCNDAEYFYLQNLGWSLKRLSKMGVY